MNEEKQRQTAGVLFFKVTVALPELPSPLFAVAIAHTFRFDYHESVAVLSTRSQITTLWQIP
jgi:hypothetical protein